MTAENCVGGERLPFGKDLIAVVIFNRFAWQKIRFGVFIGFVVTFWRVGTNLFYLNFRWRCRRVFSAA
ncbi:hypothetical protein TMES_18250 [Thalassospira mesophila]|uniref:Uncharacterized protein n=1 Tax=Thalassospira mesophila TaxID=1293891 RepID=A0A1Y2KWF4_9PROT|nr:hypothetical protein TMES_18250 [Thalassospira mesophila]